MARVLLIDDERTVLEMMRVILASEGHEVVAFKSGHEALEILASDQKFDLLVTDLRMAPLNGLEILRQARVKRPHLRAIVCSAFYSAEIERQAAELGCTSFVKKPFRMNDMLDAIARALEVEVEV